MSNTLVAPVVDTTSPFSGAFLLQDGEDLSNAISTGSWVSGGLASFSTALDIGASLADPIGTLVANGLGWLLDHFEPLKTWMTQLTGNADEVAAFGQTWSNVATRMRETGQNLQTRVGDLSSLSGATIDAYRQYADDLAQHVHSMGNWAGAVATGLEIASQLVRVVHDLVRDAIAQVVGMAVSAATELIVSVGTAAPAVIGQITARVSALATRVGRTVTKLLESMKSLRPLLQSMQRLGARAGELLSGMLVGTAHAAPVKRLVAEGGADAAKRAPHFDVQFKLGSGHDKVEFERQLAGQEAGMNKLSIDDFLTNRDGYLSRGGRDPAGDIAQDAARKEALIAKTEELRGTGLSRAEAKSQAEDWLKTQAALHNPDQIAGGFADRITDMGDKNINSSIGSQWRTRIGALDEHIRTYAEGLSAAERKSTLLNVSLKP
ncbi:hypothetical protein GCM10027515_08290 [Schumannella luteola]|uniref:Novel toxin 15 domain-containing protein n=1 Tax=Schumannella luteola TaxID=472059 RepID=A0A852Y838_9MICO|nr:polymorphic toxin type 15 domain-containing protein [Schumannella luteola]NYG98042.1 hypothetical protein [Schumannella luteola]